MTDQSTIPSAVRWAQFRYGVVGPLLVAPPQQRGELRAQLQELADRVWPHPLTGAPVRFGCSTVERWYYTALRAKDPITALSQRRRCDRGRFLAVPAVAQERLVEQYRQYPGWSTQLHAETLAAWWTTDAAVAGLPVPSVRTVQRFLRRRGLRRRQGPLTRGVQTDEAERTRERLEQFEVRSYRVTHAHALWHVDFHHGKQQVLDDHGERMTPVLIAYIDDHTRFVPHAQWYPAENTEAVVHTFVQAVRRSALPRAVLSDNGKPFVAAEMKEGLGRLGVLARTTLCYAPHQNGKIECFWGAVEGRLMAQLVHERELTLYRLNRLTQAWLLADYHRQLHGGLASTPIECLQTAPSVGRPPPDAATLDAAFTRRIARKQRQSDGTVVLQKRRFEVPSRYRHMRDLVVRQAHWRPSVVYLIDDDRDQVLCRLPECDPAANASGQRRQNESPVFSDGDTCELPSEPPVPPAGLPPVVASWEDALSRTGMPTPFLPLDNRRPTAAADEEASA